VTLGGERLVWAYCREELEGKNRVTGANQVRRRFCFKAHSPIRVWSEDQRLGELFYCFFNAIE